MAQRDPARALSEEAEPVRELQSLSGDEYRLGLC